MLRWTVNMPWWMVIIIGMFAVPVMVLWYTFYFIFVWPLRVLARNSQRSRDGYKYGSRRW